MVDKKLSDIFIDNPVTELGADSLVLLTINNDTTPASAAIEKPDLFAQVFANLNYKLATSIVSSDLVLELVDLDGNDFSAANPLYVKLSDELATISAALSVTKADGTNWANLGSSELATQEVDLFAYLISETGASAGVKLGWSRIPYGTVVGDFSSTTTNEKYLAGPTNYNATDKVQNIGRFNAILSAGAAYTWSLPATSLIINQPIYQTRPLTFAPVKTGYSTDPTDTAYQYTVNGRNVLLSFYELTNGVSNATTKDYTLPFTSENVAGQGYVAVLPLPLDNAAFQPAGVGTIAANSNQIFFYKSQVTAWTASGACKITGCQIFIKI